MVGVPRSKGCQTCISRRTKCDEARPACGNCIKYGSCCPGYDRGFKFVAIKHNVRRPRGRRQPQQQSHSSPAVYVRRPHPSSGAASQGSRQTTGVDDGGDHQQRHVPGPHAVTALEKIQSAVARKQTVPPAPRHNTAQYVGTLLETLQRVSPQDESFATGTWIGGAAGRLSDARVLETAVYGFTQHLLGKLNRDDQAIAHARTLYGSSLKLLQQSLNHPEKWKMPETLGASLTLCFYEVR